MTKRKACDTDEYSITLKRLCNRTILISPVKSRLKGLFERMVKAMSVYQESPVVETMAPEVVRTCRVCDATNEDDEDITFSSDCYFCVKNVCSRCSVICKECNQLFCTFCSIRIYDSRDETSVCLTCRR